MRQDGDRGMSTFGTMYGEYESLVMPSGLANATTKFQYIMGQIFEESEAKLCTLGLLLKAAWHQNPGEGVMCYLDNVLVYEPDKESVDCIRKWFLEALQDNILFLNALKCTFYNQQVVYISLILTPEGMEP